MVLGFHLALRETLRKSVANINADSSTKLLASFAFGDEVRIGIVWKTGYNVVKQRVFKFGWLDGAGRIFCCCHGQVVNRDIS